MENSKTSPGDAPSDPSSNVAEVFFALIYGIPAAIGGINLMTGYDLRYWPDELSRIYAPVVGLILLVFSAYAFWIVAKKIGASGNKDAEE